MSLAEPNAKPTLPSLGRHAGAWFDSQIATLYPGCFALIMATGIISNAFFVEGWRGWSDTLLLVNLVSYPCLVLFTILRLARFPRALWADLIDPRLVFSFFTLVAGTSVFGAGIHMRGFATIALLMWLFALLIWFVLIYFSFGVLVVVNNTKQDVLINGAWLMAIVGTESLVILGTLIAPANGDVGEAVVVFIHMLWGVGLGLYGIFIVLFCYRICFFDVRPDDVTPALWVVMGAAAITTNAGSTLILADTGLPILHVMRPFIDGVTIIVWAWATWWIPPLLLLGIWKHGVARIPLTYTPLFWSLVFPLGMYGIATRRLSLATDFAPLRMISAAMLWIALAAWVATAVALATASWRSFCAFRRSGPALR